MIPDLYTRLAHHLHALGMGYPLKDDLLDILRANFSPAEAEVALAVPNSYTLQQVGYGFPQTFFWKGERTPHAGDLCRIA